MKNELILIGNVGTDALLKDNGLVKIRLVTKEKCQVKKSGEFKTREEWHSLVFSGKVAEAAKGIKKGMRLYIEGKVHYVHIENESGKRVFMVVLVKQFQRLHELQS